jgi:hypothetical protein
MITNRHGQNCSKRILIHVRSLATSTWDYDASVSFAERIYGSIGVLFHISSAMCPVMPDDVAVRLAVVDGACSWNQFSAEQTDLYAYASPGSSGITVFIVGGLAKADGSALAGCAGHAVGKPSAVISATGTVYTMAHEVGHVLLGSTFSPVHTETITNIMVNGTFRIGPGVLPTFTAEQRTRILASTLLESV